MQVNFVFILIKYHHDFTNFLIIFDFIALKFFDYCFSFLKHYSDNFSLFMCIVE